MFLGLEKAFLPFTRRTFRPADRLYHGRAFGRSLANGYLRAEIQHTAHQQAQTYLPHHFEATFEPVLVLAEDLDIIVQKPDRPHPKRRYEQQHEVDIVQTGKEQHRHDRRQDDDHPAHRRSSGLFLLSGQAQMPHRLSDLLAAQETDDLLAEHQGDD